jgi:haloalkane dehalogenase
MTKNNKRPEWLTHSLYPFEDKWIEIDKNIIHYIDEGEGDIILFSHAAVGWSFMYRNIIKILSKSYRCIAIDFPGFGLSTAAFDYTFSVQGQSDIIKKFIAALNIRALYVFGHDTGGPSAFSAFTAKAASVKGFIISDALIFPVSEYGKISTMLWLASTRLFRFLNSRFNIFINTTLNGGFKKRELSAEEKNCYKKVSEGKEKRNQITSILSSLKKDESFMKALKLAFEITFNDTPALLIYGEKDPLTNLGIPFRIADMLKNVQLKFIAGETHFPHEGAAAEIAAIIDEWIKTRQTSTIQHTYTSDLQN